jgi:transposase
VEADKEHVVAAQVFFEDETGVNGDTLRRMYGRGPRPGAAPVAPIADQPRGKNHSVLVDMSSSGIIAHETLVKDRGPGTRGADCAHFVETLLGPSMLQSARAAGLPPTAPLYLVMDNASIHHTTDVKAAAASVSSRIVFTYLPPYASTMNPVELFSSDFGAMLRRSEVTRGQTLSNLIGRCIREDLKSSDRYSGYYRHCGWH